MRPSPIATPAERETDLFRNRLDNLIDMRHELAQLAGLIDWNRFDEAFGPLYRDKIGRPGLPTRLMAGLHLLKHMKGLSDEQVSPSGWRTPTSKRSAARSTSATLCRSIARR